MLYHPPPRLPTRDGVACAVPLKTWLFAPHRTLTLGSLCFRVEQYTIHGQKSFPTLVCLLPVCRFYGRVCQDYGVTGPQRMESCVSDECLGADVKLNGDPPECALGECMACAQPFQLKTLMYISGRTSWKSGYTERLASSCSVFYPVVHDPCPLRNRTLTPAHLLQKRVAQHPAGQRRLPSPLISWFLIR